MNKSLPNTLLAGAAVLFTAQLSSAQIGFTGPTLVATGQQPDQVALGDLDGDGDRDMAVTTDQPDKIEIFVNDGAGSFSPGTTVFLPGGSSPAGIEAADFNGDGQLDLVVTLKNINTVQLVINNGGLSFSLGSSTSVGLEPRHIAVGDLDGDGDMDVVTSNRDSNNVSVSLNGGGTLGASASYPAGMDPRDVALGDFGGDGALDICVAGHDSRDVNVLTNTGSGTFTGPVNLSVGAQLRPEGLATADLDNDGDTDIAASTSGNGLNFASVFLNSGGNFSGPFNYAVGGVDPGSIVAGDFDLDGDPDLATTNQSSSNVSVLENLGAAVFGAPTLLASGTSPDDVTGADLDGNGSMDLVNTNTDSNNVSVYLNVNGDGGPSTYCVAAPNSAGPGAQIGSSGSTSIAANDFTLTISGAVPSQPGVFYYGANQTQVPFGEGFRCVDGPFFRLNPPQTPDGTGSTARLVDFTSGPAGSGPGQITAGSTWNFQFWYRDPAGGPNGFNLSNALSATFQP